MPKTYKLQILWSRRTSPNCIDHMLQDEKINCLIEKGYFRCRIGTLTGGFIDDLSKTLIVTMEPHGIISDIYVDNGKWYGDVNVPDVNNWPEMVDIMKEPVLHPLMIGDDITREYRLIHFGIIEKFALDPNRVYDGIHYDVPNHFDGDTINVLGIKEGEFKKEECIPDEIQDIAMKFKEKISQQSEKLFCIEIESTTYRDFGTSIIVKAVDINHAYVKFWNQILNDDSIDISDDWAEPLFENDDISNWVIDSSDDKSITYSSKYRDKDFIIRVKELDMSKGYALV